MISETIHSTVPLDIEEPIVNDTPSMAISVLAEALPGGRSLTIAECARGRCRGVWRVRPRCAG